LDIFTLGVLEDYLQEFEGCLLIVSHDRYFLDKLVDHTFYFKGDGEIKDILGNYTAYRKFLKEQSNLSKQKSSESKTVKKYVSREKAKLSYKEKVEFEALEGELEELALEQTKLTEQLNSGELSSEEANEKAIRLGEVGRLIGEKEDRWLELSEYAT
jgi:ATP-binding cassette subfamily F protein uup